MNGTVAVTHTKTSKSVAELMFCTVYYVKVKVSFNKVKVSFLNNFEWEESNWQVEEI